MKEWLLIVEDSSYIFDVVAANTLDAYFNDLDKVIVPAKSKDFQETITGEYQL